MVRDAVDAEQAATGVPGLKVGARVPARDEDWISGTKGDGEGEEGTPPGEKSQGQGAPSSESAQGQGAPPAGNAQAEPGPGDSGRPGRPDRWGRILSEQATSASDDSGELIELLRDLESGEGGLGPDRALLAAEAVGALFSAPGGMSVRENAALVIRELARAGVDVGKMLAAIAEVSARDRAEVAAGELRDGLKDVLGLVHRMAAATTSRVGGHLSGFDERAQGVVTSALMAQAVLDRVEAGSRKLIARVDEVQRTAEKLASGVGAAKVEVQAAATAAEGWVENAGTLGRGVWWWALVGGVMGGVMSGTVAGLIRRALAGL